MKRIFQLTRFDINILYAEVVKMHADIREIKAKLTKWDTTTKQNLDIDILELPSHLQKTMKAINENNGRGTAYDVRTYTRRARAVESAYLNQLVTMDWLSKERVGRKAVFTVKKQRVRA